MTNLYIGEAPVTLADGEHTLRFTANSWADLEEATGKPIDELLAALDPAPKSGRVPLRASQLRQMLWAGLRDDMPDAKLADVGRLIPGFGDALTECWAAVFRAVQASMPETAKPKKGGKGNAVAADAPAAT
jgi:hypothetical protein